MSSWKQKALSELAIVVSGGTPSRDVDEFWKGGNIAWVTPTDITKNKGRYLFETTERITSAGLSSCSATMLPVGSLLMTSRATLGEVKIATIPTCTNQGFKSLVPHNDVNGVFLYYQFIANRLSYKNLGSGSTFLEVSKRDTESFTLDIPFIGEQNKIAEILTTIDELIESTEAMIAKQEKIKTGMMHDLFTRGVWTQEELDRGDHKGLACESTAKPGQLRPKPTDAPNLYKDSPLGPIPKVWDVKRIGEITSSLVPGRDKPILDQGGIPWITITDIRSLYIDNSLENITLSMSSVKASNARLMPKGTVIMSCVGEFGIAGIALRSVVANQQLHGFICDYRLLPMWLTLQIQLYSQRIDRMATQTTIKYLNKTGCESVLIVVAEINEQHKSLKSLEKVINCLTNLQDQLAKLHQQKKGLMQDLLTGKVRVNVEE